MEFKNEPELTKNIGNYYIDIIPYIFRVPDFFRSYYTWTGSIYIRRINDFGKFKWKLNKKGFHKELDGVIEKENIIFNAGMASISSYKDLKSHPTFNRYINSENTYSELAKEMKQVLKTIIKEYKPHFNKLIKQHEDKQKQWQKNKIRKRKPKYTVSGGLK